MPRYLLRRVINGLRALVGGRRADAQLDEELRAFIDAVAADKVRAGLPPAQALREARLEVGGIEAVKERVRDVGWEQRASTCAQDVRYGLRVLRRTPLVTAAAILSLALGIGANTSIFTLIDAVLLRSLPLPHPEQLRQLGMRMPTDTDANLTFTNPLWEQIRDRHEPFSGVFAWGAKQFDMADGGEVRHANGLMTSGAFFSTLGVQPAAGRLLTVADDVPGCQAAAVISYGFWRDAFGGSADVVGRSIRLDRHDVPIVGVTERGFAGLSVGSTFDVALPICATAALDGNTQRLTERAWWWLSVMGRLQPGVSAEQADARLAAMSPGVMTAAVPFRWKPDMQQRFKTRVLVSSPAGKGQSSLRQHYAEPLEFLLVIASMVLLIACANIAALMLARASSRRKELAVRLAIGASRARLVRQLLTESIILSVAGAGLGLVLARWGGAVLVRAISTWRATFSLDLTPDARVLAFTTVVAIATSLLFGLWPALRATRVAPALAMKRGTASDPARPRRDRAGQGIAATQVALSLALLVVSGLFLRSFVMLNTLDLGFDSGHVLLVTARAPAARQSADATALFDDIQARLTAVPAVSSVSRSVLSPLGGSTWDNGVLVEGPHSPVADTDSDLNYVSPGYFRTLRTTLLTGRDFSAADTKAAPLVAVVNSAFMRKFFSGADPIGRRFHLDASPGEAAPSIEIVGVVGDTEYGSMREDLPPIAYLPIAQLPDPVSSVDFQLRTGDADPLTFTRSVAGTIAPISPMMSLEFHTLGEFVDDSLAQERLLAGLSGFFGGLALLLAAVGLYGMVAYSVVQRQKETGIRLALGATERAVVGTVLREVALLLAFGVVGGAALALATTRFVNVFLFGLTPDDPATFALATGILAIVAFTAGYLPARRAARTDPLAALRGE